MGIPKTKHKPARRLRRCDCGGRGKLVSFQSREDEMVAFVECSLGCGAATEPLYDAYAPIDAAISAWKNRELQP